MAQRDGSTQPSASVQVEQTVLDCVLVAADAQLAGQRALAGTLLQVVPE